LLCAVAITVLDIFQLVLCKIFFIVAILGCVYVDMLSSDVAPAGDAPQEQQRIVVQD
jgi:hypothetical protein